MRPFCAACRRQMKPTKNGRAVATVYDGGKPYAIWLGDEYTCEGCGHQIVAGFPRQAILYHFDVIFTSMLDTEASSGNLLTEATN